MWFKKKKNKRVVYRYSIGEKISYYQSRLNNPSKKIRDNASRNLYRLGRIASGKEVFGKVFMVRDKEFDSNASPVKSRRVVCVGVKNGKMSVIPVRRNKKYVSLSKFDGCRGLNTNYIYDLNLNKVYEQRTFGNVSNDYLTLFEKTELKKKIK